MLRAISSPIERTRVDAGQAEPGADQGPAPPPRREHPAGQQQQRQDRQHDLERRDQPVERLGFPEVLGLEQRESRADRRNVAPQREPVRDQVLLGHQDEGAEVQHDLAVHHAQGAAALPGQHLDYPLVRDGIDLHPRVGHGLARDNRVHRAVDEAGDRAGDLRAERREQGAELGQPLVVQLRDRLVDHRVQVDLGDDLVGDLVGVQALLDRPGRGSAARTVATYRPVSETSLPAQHTPITETSASTQPKTMSTMERGVRQLKRRR